ncbi:protein CsiD [Salmonella enterica subsp. enterica serovar Choleraesuis]|nr:protein CsiD [Salmonella enterica subsp. enterica serovar Choleraesuis]
MKTLTFVDSPVMSQPDRLCGFSFKESAQSPRLLELHFPTEIVDAFLRQIADWPVQALEYKSFLRFEVARLLDTLCEGTLRPTLLNVLLDRGYGAFIIKPEGLNDVSQADDMVKFATAVAHLTGRSNFDAMSGQYYARFVVKNVDNSDSYLRQPHRVMELHNDGTYVDEVTDYVLMMKIDEQNMEGGNSLLLHLDDWTECAEFYQHPLARRKMRWTAPPSKNTARDVWHPVFDSDKQGRPTMRYIDQFVQPKDFEEGTWLYQLGESLENSPAKISLPVPVGSFLLINNLFWLHGRDRFTAHQDLRRELMRQRGYFSYPQSGYLQGQ